MRIMGLDVGDKRIGVALSDELGITAQGLTTLQRTAPAEDLVKLASLIRENAVEKIVAGLPRNMNGTLGPQADKVKGLLDQLLERVQVEVVYWDERLTTAAAHRTLLEGNRSRAKRKKVVDTIAAVFILQGYLDRRRTMS